MTTCSLVIATFNKAEYLDLTLASLRRQTTSRFEIVIVDDGSTDNTSDVILRHSDRLEIVSIQQENAGRSVARQRGIERASGELIIFIDDDMLASANFVEAHLAMHKLDPESCMGIGWSRSILTKVMPQEHWLTEGVRLRRIPLDDLLELYRRSPGAFSAAPGTMLVNADQLDERFDAITEELSFEDPELCAVAGQVLELFGESLDGFHFPWGISYTGNLSIEKATLEQVGGFDSTFVGWGGEDTDLCYRIHQAGTKSRLSQNALAYHQVHPHTFIREEASDNLARFLRKYDSFDCYLSLRLYFQAMSVAEVNELYERVVVAGDKMIEDELLRLWRLEAAILSASGHV